MSEWHTRVSPLRVWSMRGLFADKEFEVKKRSIVCVNCSRNIL